jgi:UDP-glucuronate 4-epimerase
MKILVTGCAGFIGSHTCIHLLKKDFTVIGIDNLNDYYDVQLKKNNISLCETFTNFTFYKQDIRTTNIIEKIKPDKIIHLASMAGVRFSIENPSIYIDVNIKGFINILEQAKKVNVKQIVYASSSSVYGLNKKVPFSESDPIETPNSPYACSKIAMEIYAKSYSQLYNMNLIGLRFFTVYGPRGRPDMAPYIFLKAIKENREFYRFGDGTTSRDYTYIDDIVDGIVAACENKKNIKCEVYNLGNSTPVSLNDFIDLCAIVSRKKAIFLESQKQLGDVPHTYADISKAKRDLDYEPKVKLRDGLRKMYESI